MLAAGVAAAQPRAVIDAIALQGEDPCVTRNSLAAQVSAWLERDELAERLRVDVHVEAGAVRFEVFDGDASIGRRAFDRLPRRCEERLATVGLAIALALDAAVLDDIVPPRAAPAIAPPEAPPARAEEPSSGSLAVALEVEALLLLEVLPEVAFAGSALVALEITRTARVRAGFVGTQSVGSSVGRGHADVALLAGRLDGCLGAEVAPALALGGCLGALVGAGRTVGHGFTSDRSSDVPWALAALRAELRWAPVRWLRLGVAVDGLAALARPMLEVRDTAGNVLASVGTPIVGAAIALAAGIAIE